ncbi:homeobox protein 5 [Scaptodrosophila lebanonensis]|uniref:Homeobox protein 5 n=1 Tax=Drosophila lebanonensis TaxID=7225 RepID=A0A6J2TPV9_DROLE|nr:homeobox protein 5 [Scaptodrosophila lebanonensis]
MQQKAEEKIDPLTRIQEEIKEVVRREEEYRQLATEHSNTTASTTTTTTTAAAVTPMQLPMLKVDPLSRIQQEIKEVERREEEYRQLATSSATPPPIQVEFESYNGNVERANNNANESDETDQGVLVTAQPAAIQSTTLDALLVPVDRSPSNTPSLTSSVNSNKEESLDEHHSDDSGISASSLSIKININNNNNNGIVKPKYNNNNNISSAILREQRYIGPNCYNLTPEPPQQKMMTRTISTPQLHGLQQRRQFAFNGSTKGVMQRFIASHGKMTLGSGSGLSPSLSPMVLSNGRVSPLSPAGNGQIPPLKLNTRTALAFLENGGGGGGSSGGGTPGAMLTNTLSPAAIERDSEGRPLRRGYVPVEQKIQRELQDLKSRETELKRLRKLNRQNTLKQSLDKLQLSTDDEADAGDGDDDEDSEVEHCYGPGKLRNAQSTLELDSNDLELAYKTSGNRSLNINAQSPSAGMRPAMSLAQLCDLTPEEAPSSHRLIAQWESLIKKNAEGSIIEAAI